MARFSGVIWLTISALLIILYNVCLLFVCNDQSKGRHGIDVVQFIFPQCLKSGKSAFNLILFSSHSDHMGFTGGTW